MGRVVEIIPAKEPLAFTKDEKPITRVAAYARVSKDTADQEDSYISQKKHAEEVVARNPGWVLTKIYADQASGLNTKKRSGFNSMMAAAKKREMDMILVKSISRFGRNVVITISSLRELAKYGVIVYFEREAMRSDDSNCTLILGIMASMAEAESISISENVNLGLKYKYTRGEWTACLSQFLGYEKSEDGEVVINESQAETVREIFHGFLDGMTLGDLAKKMETEGRLTGTGKGTWSRMGIHRILSNIKYSGDVIQGVTTTTDVINKKRETNTGQAPQYFIADAIPAIIDKQTYRIAKGELARRERGSMKIEVPGPKIRTDKNPFTGIPVCSHCGGHFNRSNARGKYVLKCYNRIHGDCRADIIPEEDLEQAVLKAAQQLWDEQPKIRMKDVPVLGAKETEDDLVSAAAAYMDNSFAQRVVDFLSGERPKQYDESITRRLIDHIEMGDDAWTVHFYGGVSVRIERTTPSKEKGRKLSRSR